MVWTEGPLEDTGLTVMTGSRWPGSMSGTSSLTVTDSDKVYDRGRSGLREGRAHRLPSQSQWGSPCLRRSRVTALPFASCPLHEVAPPTRSRSVSAACGSQSVHLLD